MKKSRNNKKIRNRKTQRQQGKFNTRKGEVVYVLPKNRTILPDSIITNLEFIDQTNLVIKNAVSNVASVRYRPSGAFDVDPNLLSSAIPGFKELSSLYGKYRVISSRCTVTFANLENLPVNVYIWPTNFDLNANYGFAAAAIAAPFAKSTVVSRAGGLDLKTLSTTMETSEIFGTDEVMFDDDFAAGITTIPVNNWFWNIGAWGQQLGFLTNGVSTLTKIRVTIQFTERIMITN